MGISITSFSSMRLDSSFVAAANTVAISTTPSTSTYDLTEIEMNKDT